MISKPNFQPLESNSKANSTLKNYFERQLASIGKIELSEHAEGKIQPTSNQLNSLQPLG